jgi:aspartyl-tRNA(Asn)/glutamyl-tRNA(Gln) amidotransferase subunit C
MEITGDEVKRIARLAHLEIDDAHVQRMAAELTKIVSYIDQLREIDVTGIADEQIASMPLREDEPRPATDRELVARNAPAWAHGFFVVPKVIGGE